MLDIDIVVGKKHFGTFGFGRPGFDLQHPRNRNGILDAKDTLVDSPDMGGTRWNVHVPFDMLSQV
ncbi:hypothetical protein N7540_006178 [Penicillium herquei]|nr:hypothetical protein N7540_006178 [Penicillium herquei]